MATAGGNVCTVPPTLSHLTASQRAAVAAELVDQLGLREEAAEGVMTGPIVD